MNSNLNPIIVDTLEDVSRAFASDNLPAARKALTFLLGIFITVTDQDSLNSMVFDTLKNLDTLPYEELIGIRNYLSNNISIYL